MAKIMRHHLPGRWAPWSGRKADLFDLDDAFGRRSMENFLRLHPFYFVSGGVEEALRLAKHRVSGHHFIINGLQNWLKPAARGEFLTFAASLFFLEGYWFRGIVGRNKASVVRLIRSYI
jgi:hypothetical protein